MVGFFTVLFIFTFFCSTAISEERLSVNVKIANIRSAPKSNSEILWSVEKYHPFVIIKKSGDWYRCQDFEGDQGWVSKSLLQKIPSVITKKDNCNVRSGPSSDQKIIFSVEKGVPFKVLTRKNKWIQVEHADGDRGWIEQSLVW
ncbi:MAG: SH3 domain-containing protein [Desulfobacterales bacterium]|nr:SH3 domain-containing protein [Desulfobacterales bacterium]